MASGVGSSPSFLPFSEYNILRTISDFIIFRGQFLISEHFSFLLLVNLSTLGWSRMLEYNPLCSRHLNSPHIHVHRKLYFLHAGKEMKKSDFWFNNKYNYNYCKLYIPNVGQEISGLIMPSNIESPGKRTTNIWFERDRWFRRFFLLQISSLSGLALKTLGSWS